MVAIVVLIIVRGVSVTTLVVVVIVVTSPPAPFLSVPIVICLKLVVPVMAVVIIETVASTTNTSTKIRGLPLINLLLHLVEMATISATSMGTSRIVATTIVLLIVALVAVAATLVIPTPPVMIVVPMLVTRATMLATPSTLMSIIVIVMRSVDFKPIELMLLVLEEECRIALFCSHLRQDGNDLDKTEGIKSSVVLLTVSQWAPLPV